MPASKYKVLKMKRVKNPNFSEKFLDQIEHLLLTEKSDLEKKLTSIGVKLSDNDYEAKYEDYGSDEDDNVHEVESYEVNKAYEITLEKQLRDVVGALKRLEDGTYGICKYTAKPIDEKRLLARPTSSASVEAKEQLQGLKRS